MLLFVLRQTLPWTTHLIQLVPITSRPIVVIASSSLLTAQTRSFLARPSSRGSLCCADCPNFARHPVVLHFPIRPNGPHAEIGSPQIQRSVPRYTGSAIRRRRCQVKKMTTTGRSRLIWYVSSCASDGYLILMTFIEIFFPIVLPNRSMSAMAEFYAVVHANNGGRSLRDMVVGD